MVETARNVGEPSSRRRALAGLPMSSESGACPATPSSVPWRNTTRPSRRAERPPPRGRGSQGPAAPALRGRQGRAVHNAHCWRGSLTPAAGCFGSRKSDPSPASTPPGSRSAASLLAGTRVASPRPSSSAGPPLSRRSQTRGSRTGHRRDPLEFGRWPPRPARNAKDMSKQQ